MEIYFWTVFVISSFSLSKWLTYYANRCTYYVTLLPPIVFIWRIIADTTRFFDRRYLDKLVICSRTFSNRFHSICVVFTYKRLWTIRGQSTRPADQRLANENAALEGQRLSKITVMTLTASWIVPELWWSLCIFREKLSTDLVFHVTRNAWKWKHVTQRSILVELL